MHRTLIHAYIPYGHVYSSWSNEEFQLHSLLPCIVSCVCVGVFVIPTLNMHYAIQYTMPTTDRFIQHAPL
jgi:hypothetical protein